MHSSNFAMIWFTVVIIMAIMVVAQTAMGAADQWEVPPGRGTLHKTLDQARLAHKPGTPLRLTLGDGEYALTQPIELGPMDGGLEISAKSGQHPIVHGSVPLQGWRTTSVNGKSAWEADYDGPAFRMLLVNGEPRTRARWPALPEGTLRSDAFLRLESVPGLVPNGAYNQHSDRFVLKAGDFIARRNLNDVEIVALHKWIASRMPAESYDSASRLYISTHVAPLTLQDGSPAGELARYYIDNCYEALKVPGQWYLDRSARRVYYIPLPGEKLGQTTIWRAELTQLLKIHGTAETPVQNVRISGIHFAGTDWQLSREEASDHHSNRPKQMATSGQAENDLPGVLEITYTRSSGFRDCEFSAMGFTALKIGDGCRDIQIESCTMRRLGGGGIHLSGGGMDSPKAQRIANISIRGNRIVDAGEVFHAAVGVLVRHASEVTIADNEIARLKYTGISVGWIWGYGPSVCANNRIEHNWIHDIGQGWLSDMGGIYTLGMQPGMVIRNNLIHDVNAAAYGGWAYYFDEGSAQILMEQNVGYRTSHAILHLHYGKENTVRNNILAGGPHGTVVISRPEPHTGLILERNVLLNNGKPVLVGGMEPAKPGAPPRTILKDNLVWDISGEPVMVGPLNAPVRWENWAKPGAGLAADPHLEIQDLLFSDSAPAPHVTLDIAPQSPAAKLGITSFDAGRR